MPCFNAEESIEKSIMSVIGQTYKNIELIVVDDGSDDKSLLKIKKIAKKDHRVVVLSQKNKKAAAARNAGLRRALGEYIAFLDSDDFWAQNFIEKMLRGIYHTKNLRNLAYCGWQNLHLENGDGKPYIPPRYSNKNLVKLKLKGCLWPIHCVLFHKNLIDRVSGFDEECYRCEDYDLWLRMSPYLRVTRIAEVMAYYPYDNQTKKNKAEIALAHFRIQKKFINNHPEIINSIGIKTLKKITLGELIKKGYICYWNRDLESARSIFKEVMRNRYGKIKDWKYMLPSIFPVRFHQLLIKLFSMPTNIRRKNKNTKTQKS